MKNLLLSTLLLTGIGICNASPLTPEAALNRVETSTTRKAPAKSQLKLRLTETAASQPTVYLFAPENGTGFLAVSADDSSTPLLGYSDKGVLPSDISKLPEGMTYWLQTLSDQIAINSSSNSVPARATTSRATIEPLCRTEWNQSAPYNDLCPEVDSTRCVTGCVATALAQVVKYFNYPATGSGSHSYSWNSQTLSFDYASTTFQWDEMLDTYDDSSTDAQKEAVATLMYACGVAVDMNYGTSSSGTVSVKLLDALATYLNYDKGLRYMPREYYGDDEWEQIIYDNLTDYGPVLYGGVSNTGAHQFVCDGYANGYFHFNWGWGGLSDGYFLLSALNPGEQGIGGSTSGYNFDQDIIANVTPNQVSTSAYEQILWKNSFYITPNTVTLGNSFYVEGAFFNYSLDTLKSPEVGVKYTSTETGETYFGRIVSYQQLPRLYGASGQFTSELPSNLPDGTYTVVPAFTTSTVTTPRDIPVPLGEIGSYTLVLENGSGTFTATDPGSVEATDFTLETSVYAGMEFKTSATLSNPSESGEFLGSVAVGILQNDTLRGFCSKSAVDILPGESQDWEYIATAPSSLSAGDYTMALYVVYDTGSYTRISDPISVSIHAASYAEITVTEFNIPDGQRPDLIQGTGTVKCTSGYFAGTLDIYIFPANGGRSLASGSSDFITVAAPGAESSRRREASSGEAQFSFSIPFEGGEEGTSYMAAIPYGSSWISPYVTFTTDITTSANAIAGGNDITGVEYISLTGVSLGSTRPSAGVYIVRTTHSDGSVTTSRVAL